MRARDANHRHIVRLLGGFTATAVVLGLLGAGLLMPAVGATGAAARQRVRVFDSLPSEFALTPLSQRSRILASDGTLIAIPNDQNRVIVKNQILDRMRALNLITDKAWCPRTSAPRSSTLTWPTASPRSSRPS